MKAIVIAAAAALALTTGVASADQALAQKSACMSCHQLDKKVVGPSFRDVAKKYKGDAKADDHLVTVIKKGGKGVWGPVPMPPHPQVSDDNAEKLAKWVLSL
ncbi:MAG: c-type cytochrome [Thiobacillus sp.]|nr:c-type cytochrome [Pseudomonadota bacterium]MDP1923344.1 c-type cytochrome [Thiobacillus sp.]MDP2353101.1 c-type cytochrome [Pseudomonadota bacterium]